MKFWSDLSLVGLQTTGGQEKYQNGSDMAVANLTAGNIVDNFIPKLPIGKNVGIIVCGSPEKKHYYRMTHFYVEGANNTVSANTDLGFKAEEAFAIDKKLDDGVAITGEVEGYRAHYPGQALRLFNTLYTGCNANGGRDYNLTGDHYCALSIRVGHINGDLK